MRACLSFVNWELGIGTLLPNYIAVFLLLINEYKTQTQNHFREIPFRIKALSEECWQMLTFLLKNEDHPPHHSLWVGQTEFLYMCFKVDWKRALNFLRVKLKPSPEESSKFQPTHNIHLK